MSGVSFENPEYTGEVSGVGTLKNIRGYKVFKNEKCKILSSKYLRTYLVKLMESQFSLKIQNFIQNHHTVLQNLYAYWITSVYRESYGIFACNGILFNHESPRRGETFVTRKITRFLTRKKLGSKETLYLGNMNAKRDWGHAKDYTEMQWRIMQQKKPKDYVIATGHAYSVKQFVNIAASYLGMKILWTGKGLKEIGYIKNKNKKEIIIRIDKNYFRPNEVEYLKGDASKALRDLKFKPKYSFKDLVKDMIDSDLKEAKKEQNKICSNLM